MSVQFDALKAELINDPLARGYAGMTDAAAVTSLTTADRDNWNSLEAAQIFESLDLTEFAALSAGDQARVDRVLGLSGQIATAPGGQARQEMINVFGGGSQTIQNLASIANTPRSRANELGIGDGYVIESRVAAARA